MVRTVGANWTTNAGRRRGVYSVGNFAFQWWSKIVKSRISFSTSSVSVKPVQPFLSGQETSMVDDFVTRPISELARMSAREDGVTYSPFSC